MVIKLWDSFEIISKLFFHHNLLMQAVKDYTNIIQKLIMFVYQTMDYWLPALIFLTLPLWLLPTVSAYLSWKLYCICKCFLKIGNNLMSNCSTAQFSYAVLKGNGRYLREDCSDTLKKQFYDYTSRRFMSIGEFQPNTKIVQLECYNQTGLLFFSETIQQENIKGLQSNQNKLRKSTSSLSLINKTNYQIQGQPENYDCAMLFDFKRKLSTYLPNSKIDLLRILSFCRFHMHDSGYMVYGDYFEEGQIHTYIELFNGFNLKVVDQEDVTKNIEYAAKIEAKQKISFEQKFYEVFMAQIGSIIGWKKYEEGKRFIVLILEKA